MGSSPLTRGKPGARSGRPARGGLIPAHAGKTDGVGLGRPGLAAHPRSRGENTPPGPLAEGEVGSSPLTRGKLSVLTYSFRCTGLIPAHAGKTEMSSNHPRGCRAHPRSRGENSPFSHIVFGVLGSSPLTRGKLRCQATTPGAVGLIPAHAGKTNCRVGCVSHFAAHPRSRGENRPAHTNLGPNLGSSPLTRGKHNFARACVIRERLIPAHAGKTRSRLPSFGM